MISKLSLNPSTVNTAVQNAEKGFNWNNQLIKTTEDIYKTVKKIAAEGSKEEAKSFFEAYKTFCKDPKIAIKNLKRIANQTGNETSSELGKAIKTTFDLHVSMGDVVKKTSQNLSRGLLLLKINAKKVIKNLK